MLFQFKIQLKNVTDPTVWRRITVPDNFSFYKFHLAIQAVFDWDNYHLFQFSPRGYGTWPVISIPEPEYDDINAGERLDAKKTKLKDIFIREKQKYIYIYDFGDDWKHEITLEKITDADQKKASCIAGKGACPPEDCGGPWGYEELKEKLSDPADPEYEEIKEWLGMDEDQEWDPGFFDITIGEEMIRKI